MSKVGASRPPSHDLLRSPPPLEDPLGEFPSLRYVRRVKPHRKWCPVARATLSVGEPLPRPRRATAHSATTSPIPFRFNKIRATDWRINDREWSTVTWTHEPRSWTRSLGLWTYSMGSTMSWTHEPRPWTRSLGLWTRSLGPWTYSHGRHVSGMK
jgi:hypothetical protein